MKVEEQLSDLLIRWEELQKRGTPITPEELCRDCPQLVDQLRQHIRALQSLHPALDAVNNRGSGYESQKISSAPAEDSGLGIRRARSVPGYEILGELGRGGMGVVYKARQKSLDRVVALKMILAGASAAPQQRARFQVEAEAIARLQHPNIVQVYEFGEQDRCPYFSLEYVEGRTLREYLSDNVPTPLHAAAFVEQLARAVDYAHQRGIIHRDLKPCNILLTHTDIPKITDFGLAKRLDGGSGYTRDGDVLGTPSYMAPEQAAGNIKEIGPRTDIYSLGAILYEMVAGRPPFEGASDYDTVYQVLTAEPERPSRYNPQVPRDLEVICLKCLEKAPTKRYATALDLAEELRRFHTKSLGDGPPIGSSEVSHAAEKNCQTAPVQLYITNGISYLREGDLLASLLFFARALKCEQNKPHQEAHRLRIAAVLRNCPRLSQVRFLGDDATDVAFSPDGRWILTAGSDQGTQVWDATSGKLRFDMPLQHNSSILRASFSPDGKRIVTASSDRTARIWDAVSGKCVAVLQEHQDVVRDARFSLDGRRIVTASDDKTVRIWNAVTYKVLCRPLLHEGPVVQALFHPDGSRVLTASRDGSGRIWQPGTDSAYVATQLRHQGPLTDACFDPTGKVAATASEDGTACIWDTRSGEQVSTPLRHHAAVRCVVFSPDSAQVATASADLTAWVWDAKIGTTIFPPLRHKSHVTFVAFSPDGTRLLTGSDDNTARLWDGTNGRPLSPPLLHNGTVHRACFSPDGSRIATVAADSIARVYDLVPIEPPVPALKHGGRLWHASFDAEGRKVVTAGSDGTARVWDAKTGKQLTMLCGHQDEVFYATFSNDGSRILTASADTTARIWDASTGCSLVILSGHQGRVRKAMFSSDGCRVLTVSDDKTSRIWDAKTGRAMVALGDRKSSYPCEILDAVFRSHGRIVATSSTDGTARIWDAVSGVQIGRTIHHKRSIVRVTFSPDGRRLASASLDHTAQLWDATNGEALLRTPLQHSGPVRDVAFSPNGLAVVTASEDNTARIWETDSGKPLLPPLSHNGTVSTARFSRNGRWIVTASEDNMGRVWDARTGEPLTPALTHPGWGRITCAVFSPGDDRVLTASEDGTAQLTPLDRVGWPPEHLERLAELMCGNRIGSDFVSRVPFDAQAFQRLWGDLRKQLPARI